MQDKAPAELQYGPTLPVEEFGGWLQDRISSYYRYLQAKNFLTQWKKCYTMYYGGKVRGGSILRGGDEGQYSVININDFRSVTNALITMCVDERPDWEPKAINSDVKSQRQTILAKGLLDYYMKEKRVERDLLQAVEFGVLFGEGFVSVEWDPTMGKQVSVNPETNMPLNAGDLRFMAHEPIDIIRDVRLEQYRQRDWIIIRKYVNKWNLAAKFPEHAEDISRMNQGLMFKDHYRLKETFPFSTDIITMYCFYHSQTAAMPKGRFTLMLEDQTILADGILPYEHIPLFRVAPSDIIGSPFGYPQAYDMTAIQENIDMLYSTVLTNQEMFGIQNILCPIGAGINYTQIPGQMNFIEYNKDVGEPKPLQLLGTPPEIPNMIKVLEQKMIQIAGLNSVSMGNTPSADMSGAALALLDAKAVKLNSPTQWSYVALLEDLGTMTIQILKDYAKAPRIAAIVGKSNKSNLVSFTGNDIDQIDRVMVEEANPISDSVSGRLQLAQMLIQSKAITTADEILELVNTGSIEPLIQGKTAELLAIQTENEALMDGMEVQVLRTDDHVLHIQEHKSVLSDPLVRNDPNAVAIAGNHINMHIQMLQDPNNAALFELIHQPSLAPQGGGPGTPGGPPMNPPQEPNQQQAKHIGSAGQVAPTPANPQAPMPPQAQLPNAPKVAGTNAPAPVPGAAVKPH